MRLNYPLKPYQKKGVDKLLKVKVGALFMEQGTGKTITTLELCRERIERKRVDKIIWLCPFSAKENIKKEIIKDSPRELLSYIVICGIETLSTSVRANAYLQYLAENYACYLVVDESLLVKNPRALRTKNIMSLSSKCKYKIILNGTPISKNIADLYSQFYILDWRILGYRSFWSFEANHLEYSDKYPGQVVNTLNESYIIQKIEPYTYQCLKSECETLPPKIYYTEYFNLTDEQVDHYHWVADKLMFDLDEFKPETIYRLFSGLQAVISGKRVSFKKSKYGYEHIVTTEFFQNPEENPRIQCLLDILDNDEKHIIFCNYTSEITAVCNILNKRKNSAVRYDGKISSKIRAMNINEFESDAQFLVANRRCAGYSHNLQFCHNIIYFSNGWDLGTRLQSEERVHRISQENTVNIIDICAGGTLDERIQSCFRHKENILGTLRHEMSKYNDLDYIKKWLFVGENRCVVPTIYDCSDLEVQNA